MAERLIIADDLTGALDAAAPFAARGVETVVAINAAALTKALATGADVVGVSSDSREIPADDARAAMARIMTQVPADTPLFKKIDSRLKGNIAAELDALPHQRSIVVPAIPTFGRWTRDGHLGGFGVAEPIDIAARLGRHGARAHIPDIARQDDIVAALDDSAFDLPIGARGLAEAMAARLPSARAPSVPPLPQAPIYCVIGSTDPITTIQLERLRAGCAEHRYIAAPNGVSPELEQAPAPLTIVQATPGQVAASGKAVAEALSDSLLRLAPPAGSLLVLSGGATAQVILERMDIDVLHLMGEALPGLPLAQAKGFTIITKSGGFGDGDTLLRLLVPDHRL